MTLNVLTLTRKLLGLRPRILKGLYEKLDLLFGEGCSIIDWRFRDRNGVLGFWVLIEVLRESLEYRRFMEFSCAIDDDSNWYSDLLGWNGFDFAALENW